VIENILDVTKTEMPDPEVIEESQGVIKFVLKNPATLLRSESVVIPMRSYHNERWHTLCVSSQMGCSRGCSFCATGKLNLKGNLSTGDIVQQLASADSILMQKEELGGIRNIVFMGMGSLDVIVKEFEERFPNIHFHPAVRPQEVHLYTRDCDVGISLIENVCLSYYLSLPNKLFEYIMSGLPVIVSDFPEMTAVVNQGRCGWTVPVEKEAVFSLISGLSKDDVDEKRSNALEYRKTLGWHNEEKVIVSALRNVLHPNEHSKPEM